jgi:hypothetical protein
VRVHCAYRPLHAFDDIRCTAEEAGIDYRKRAGLMPITVFAPPREEQFGYLAYAIKRTWGARGLLIVRGW